MDASFLDGIFQPMLMKFEPWLSILIISFLITLLITLAYKWMTDQVLMKQLKDDIKKYQEESKKLRNEPDQMMKVQKKMMDANMKYMMHSFKPTLITFLPIIIIFGYLNTHLVYEPIYPGQMFSAELQFAEDAEGMVMLDVPPGITAESTLEEIRDGKARFKLKGSEGIFRLTFRYDEKDYSKDVQITYEQKYSEPSKTYDDTLKMISISQDYLRPFGTMSFFGWKPGWLGAYILFSISLSILLRKILKIY